MRQNSTGRQTRFHYAGSLATDHLVFTSWRPWLSPRLSLVNILNVISTKPSLSSWCEMRSEICKAICNNEMLDVAGARSLQRLVLFLQHSANLCLRSPVSTCLNEFLLFLYVYSLTHYIHYYIIPVW